MENETFSIGIIALLLMLHFLLLIILLLGYWLTINGYIDGHIFPTPCEVNEATDKQIKSWAKHLPAASTDSEIEAMDLIARRHLNIIHPETDHL